MRRSVQWVGLLAMLCGLALAGAGASGAAENNPGKPGRIYLRIATGPVWGTYFPVGAAIARVVSQPSGAAECRMGISCGVAGVTAVASASEGSLVNLRLIASGFVETGIAQADLVADAYRATGAFAGERPYTNLRAIAALYPEAVQIVAAKRARIKTIGDLRGKRIGIGSPRSGTNPEARRLLKAFGLSAKAVRLREIGGDEAASLIAAEKLDAMIHVGGWPAPPLADLLAKGKAVLVPIDDARMERMVAQSEGLLMPLSIPAEAYGLSKPVLTIGVQSLWVANAGLRDDLIEGLCRALFQPASHATLSGLHPMGTFIDAAHALDGVAIPLHPGAARCYEGLGVSGPFDPVKPADALASPQPRSRPASAPSPAASR